MKRRIDQFMWSFQQHFRVTVERELERSLSNIGLVVRVQVLLVGFAIVNDVRHRLCVEPEDGMLSPGDLSDVSRLSEELYNTDPESEIIHWNTRLHQSRQNNLRLRARAKALVTEIEASGLFPEMTFFASTSAPIQNYRVHTCVGIPTQIFESLVSLESDRDNFMYVGKSLQHEVINECLRRADRALYLPDPGEGIEVLGSTDDIVKTATERLVDGMVYRTGGVASDLFRAANEFTSLSYERANNTKGCLIVTNAESAVELANVRFQNPVSMHNARSMRKLLELSDDSIAILADCDKAYGLGDYNAVTDSIEIRVRGHADWEVFFSGIALIRVRNGHAKLPPKPPITRERFVDLAGRTVGSIKLDSIWNVIDKAQMSGYGMTLVISHDPAGETSRLGGQAIPIAPHFLSPAGIVRLGCIDGAVILGSDGLCYAFGVILDGDAEHERGDPSRGSRFNSAIRYQRTKATNSLVVVISDDGMVDLIPSLRPKVHRQKVEQAVIDFCTICATDSVDGEKFSKAFNTVEELAFYLNKDQCDRINESHKIEMERRLEAGGIAIGLTPLRPHSDMDDSYFY